MKSGRGGVEAGEAVEAELDRMIERRGSETRRTGQDVAVEEVWRESERKHDARLRDQRRWEWVRFFEGLAESHALIGREFERRALELLEDTEPKGEKR